MSPADGKGAVPFDAHALQAYIAEHVPGMDSTLQVTRFKGGQSNPTFMLETSERRFVLRTKPGPSLQLLPSAQRAPTQAAQSSCHLRDQGGRVYATR